MKKIYITIIVASLSLGLISCSNKDPMVLSSEANKLDVKNACNVEANGLDNVLKTAKKFNPIAQKAQVEFMRFNISTAEYIRASEEAINNGIDKVTLIDTKKKKTSMNLDYAVWRACTFAIRPLQQEHEAENTWRLSVPGDGFKY